MAFKTLRKLIFISALIILGLGASAQSEKATVLAHVAKSAGLKPGEAIIYGSFLRKPGMAFGDYQHFIRIENIETNEYFLLEVKPYEIVPAKETSFYNYIKPGTYQIIGYEYAKTNLLGYKIFYRPVFKNVDYNSTVNARPDSSTLKRTDLLYFTFKIEQDRVYYVGRWNFDTGIVSFSNDKEALDKRNSTKYNSINFESARVVVPY